MSRGLYFERQEQAKRASFQLFLFFGAALLLVIVATVLVVVFGFQLLAINSSQGGGLWPLDPGVRWDRIIPGTALVTLGVIGIQAYIGLKSLSQGGRSVAHWMGARILDPNSSDELERRYWNVLEEMSIASGVPVPLACVMDAEHSINAFAAGTGLYDSVVGVTKGALIDLNRDELQGIVAHEMSHIVHRDVKLNLTALSLISSISLISTIGWHMLRSLRHIRLGSRRNGEGLLVVLVLAMIGICFIVIGSLGSFFANLIQRAISRKREYLADASAVQYTRNPDGILQALIKIQKHPSHSTIQKPEAAAASHMFFSSSHSILFSTWLDSHPPLEQRILWLQRTGGRLAKMAFRTQQRKQPGTLEPTKSTRTPSGRIGDGASPAMAAHFLGEVGVALADFGLKGAEVAGPCLIRHTPVQAASAIFSMLFVTGAVPETEFPLSPTLKLDVAPFLHLRNLPLDKKLALLRIEAPRLRGLSSSDRTLFLQILSRTAQMDEKITVTELAIVCVTEEILAKKSQPRGIMIRTPQVFAPHAFVLLHWLAHSTTGGVSIKHHDLVALIMNSLSLGLGVSLSKTSWPIEQTKVHDLLKSIPLMARATPVLKAQVLDLLPGFLSSLGLNDAQAAIIDALSLALACPMPLEVAQTQVQSSPIKPG